MSEARSSGVASLIHDLKNSCILVNASLQSSRLSAAAQATQRQRSTEAKRMRMRRCR